jgi:class 3 adenylate cyclase
MSSQSPPSIHYEVYTQDSGTRWNLHARYERNERDAAILDAKTVEKTLQIPAKVIREVYYPANNHSEEALVYAGDPGLRAKMAARANALPNYRGRGQARQSAAQLFKAQIAADAPSPASIGGVAKFLIVVVASLTVAGTVTSLLNASMDPIPGQVEQGFQSLILFSTFMVTFVAVALPLSTSLLKWRLFGRSKARRTAAPKMPPPPMPKPEGQSPPEEIEPEEELDWEDLKDEDEALPPIEDDEDDIPVPTPQPELPQPEPAPPVAVEEPVFDAPAEPPKAIFIRFVNALTAAVRRRRPTLDAYNMFGVDLVMAGAVDVLGNNSNMSNDERRALLKSSIEAMGVKAATAQAFADKYEDYLGEPRYLPMILSGRSNMESFLLGQDLLQDSIGPVFDQWNKPQGQAPAAASRIMTVMFTDMVGSTDMTQDRGDKAAQHVVRRHNTIVRNALAQYAGKEIKHTGDGIMATFTSAAGGVEAAISIQRTIAKHNAQNPQQDLHIRIGINAGEPIEEEEDLFGTTVQLAARVCARCDTDEILCSNVVKELASGRGLLFETLGAQELKGFKEQVVLYQVGWRE